MRRQQAEHAKAQSAAESAGQSCVSPGPWPFASSFWGCALQDMEDQTASHRTRLGKPHIDLLGEAKDKPCPASGQRLLPHIMLPVIVRQRAHGYETARTAFGNCDEKSEARHTGNSCCEICSNFVRHVGSEVTVDRIAFGKCRAAFGGGDMNGCVRKARAFVFRQ